MHCCHFQHSKSISKYDMEGSGIRVLGGTTCIVVISYHGHISTCPYTAKTKTQVQPTKHQSHALLSYPTMAQFRLRISADNFVVLRTLDPVFLFLAALAIETGKEHSRVEADGRFFLGKSRSVNRLIMCMVLKVFIIQTIYSRLSLVGTPRDRSFWFR